MIEAIISALPFFYMIFVACMTPGPNNVMLTASGMNFGYKRTIPHITGIISGYTTLLMLCAFGVGAAIDAFPPLMMGLKILGSAYLIYLAWRIYNGGRIGAQQKAKETMRPLTFLEAAAFQFINPKAIVFGLAAIALMPADISVIERIVIVLLGASMSGIVSTNTWTLFGAAVSKLFRDDKIRYIINTILALLLLATLPMMLF